MTLKNALQSLERFFGSPIMLRHNGEKGRYVVIDTGHNVLPFGEEGFKYSEVKVIARALKQLRYRVKFEKA
jgi:glyoxylase-like metal-dependent hydrolase (beta-lactamase superfamily II)